MRERKKEIERKKEKGEIEMYFSEILRINFEQRHFWSNGYVNKQNCRIWSEANPQVYVETPLHPEKLTVWCALWAGGILLQNDEGHNELWFQQDGATYHTARATIDLLKDTFGDRLISRFGPVNWPPTSCDLTPLDYFLWGYVKSLVYADKPQTLDHLEDNIRRVIADIRPQMLEKVIENWTSRLGYIRASRGSPMPEILFKNILNPTRKNLKMSSDGGKRKRQEDDEESEGTNFSNDDINQKKIDELQLKKKVQNKTRLYNGFKYPPFPQHLKNFPLDLVTERLISPRIPFMQIRRLRHVLGQFGIYGQVINVPIEVNTMVNSLPRNIDDDHSITVHIKRKKIHKSNYLCGIVNKRKIKAWLQHLKDSPLYTSYGITVDDSFFNGQDNIQDEIIYDEDGDNDISEQIPIDESLVAQQQTLMWNDEMYLTIAPGEGNVPVSLLFDEHAEELSFPQIYLGQFRTFHDGVNVTSFMMFFQF
ncbi:helitron_like_N domain-containing protein [Trichonephila clavipes]|uniref:Helitron_like_N domain-containing protein n=1 Tax=Trichonephila clavipes TaxID=2585209 RepID=A0A8X6VNJ6_TRICX|nr:helitron_like_N domain-containing protein [Trichonephila clavipes]